MKLSLICAGLGCLTIGVIVPWPVSYAAQTKVTEARTLAAADERSDYFEKQVRPLLIRECQPCHGGGKQAGNLRLDSREAAFRGGAKGAAILSGDADHSLLMEAVRQTGALKMPPSKKLSQSDLDIFAKWIRDGAVWPSAAIAVPQKTKHWSFQPIRPQSIPAVRNALWSKNPIDNFILAKLESNGLKPAPAADKRVLIRRLTFDLTGLPPTPEEVESFVQDRSPNAYTKVVERLLVSPHYGEQWGRHWLDVVRYADTAGENSDHPLPHAWKYRNWVVSAFNSNLPYDQFIREQIAGDVIGVQGPTKDYANCVVATGYLAIARRFGHDIDQDFPLTLEDTIDTLGKSVLGLSIGCARCHDHKFDPISARDYYGLYGIFNSTRFSYPGCEPHQQPRDLVPLISPGELAQKTKQLQAETTRLDTELAALTEPLLHSGRDLQQRASRGSMVLSAGQIPDGGAAELSGDTLNRIVMRKGDVLQLSISPLTNHGADSTLVELKIEEAGGAKRQWSTADLVDDLTRANPHSDRFGNTIWCFLDAQDGYLPLPERQKAIEGYVELESWRNGDTPSIFVNRSTQPVKVWTSLPPRSFFMHPGPRGPVALAWLCPADGEFSVRGRIADAHPGGPDGVGWKLEKYTSGSSQPALSDTYVSMGEQVKQQAALRQRRADLASQMAVPVAYAVTEGKLANARIQKRGEANDLGDEVPRKFLDVLGGDSQVAPTSSGRAELAKWLTRPSNPLTARVFVNRVWQWHFGQGLVKTPNDFGTRGAPPTHPELLDYLASEFIKSGWDVKALQRRILLSATYRMDSVTPGSHTPSTKDLYASFPRRRLTAEELRDSLLAVSGELDMAPGEAHPFPPEASWGFSQHAPFAAEYDTMKRSIYVMQKRNRRSRFFTVFDGADPNASTAVRDLTTVPTQALYFMNDPFVHNRADRLAARIVTSGKTDGERIDFACRLLFGRPATDLEKIDFSEFRREYPTTTVVSQSNGHADACWLAYSRVLLSSSEFLYVD